MDKNPSEISKWLSGGHNLTLRSLSKLEAELGEPLLHIPKTDVYESNNSKVYLSTFKNISLEGDTSGDDTTIDYSKFQDKVSTDQLEINEEYSHVS